MCLQLNALIKLCSYDAIRSISRFVYGIYGKPNAQKLSIELPRILACVVDTDTDNDNRTCAMNCLNNIAAYLPSLVLVGNEAVSCAIRVIREQGSGMLPLIRRFISLLLICVGCETIRGCASSHHATALSLCLTH